MLQKTGEEKSYLLSKAVHNYVWTLFVWRSKKHCNVNKSVLRLSSVSENVWRKRLVDKHSLTLPNER